MSDDDPPIPAEMQTLDEGPSDEDRTEFAESIADDLTQRIQWGEASKREVAVAAVELAMGDARLEARRLLAPPGPMYFYEVGFTRDTATDITARSFPCIRLLHDGGTVEVEVSEAQLLSVLRTTTETLRCLLLRRVHVAQEAAASGSPQGSTNG